MIAATTGAKYINPAERIAILARLWSVVGISKGQRAWEVHTDLLRSKSVQGSKEDGKRRVDSDKPCKNADVVEVCKKNNWFS